MAAGACLQVVYDDASDPVCAYALYARGFGAPFGGYTIAVAAPGYAPTDVSHVRTGVAGGCQPYVAPSNLTVSLMPLPAEAGTDAQTNDAHDGSP
jgi:hypothetical protein